MIRFGCMLLVIGLYFIFFWPMSLFLQLYKKINRKKADDMSRHLVQWIFGVLLTVSDTKITVKGLENLSPTDTVMYVGNHSSYFDIIISYIYMPTTTGFVSKKEIGDIPFLKTWMELIGCLFIDRSDVKSSLQTIKEGIERLKSGTSIFIFPEGTRSKTGHMGEFKEGSMKMAQKAKVPIVPVALSGTAALWENQFPRVKRGHVIIDFGKPIYIDKLTKEEQKHLGTYTQNKLQEMLDRNASEL